MVVGVTSKRLADIYHSWTMEENALGRKLRGHTGRVLESDDYSVYYVLHNDYIV